MGDQAIILIHKQIRRAVSSPLVSGAEAAGWDISKQLQWSGIHFDRDRLRPPAAASILSYISTEIAVDDVTIREIGPNPLFSAVGHLTMNIHSDPLLGEDGNDAVLSWLGAAYPYTSTPSFDGISVNIDKMRHRGYGSDGPWLTGLVSVDWNIYRRS